MSGTYRDRGGTVRQRRALGRGHARFVLPPLRSAVVEQHVPAGNIGFHLVVGISHVAQARLAGPAGA